MKAVREDVLINAIHDIDPEFPIDKLAKNLLKNHGYVLFKCDGKLCDEFCNTDCCYLTSEISHAADFEIILSDDKPFIVQQKTGEYKRGEQIIRAYSSDKGKNKNTKGEK